MSIMIWLYKATW